MTNDDATVDKSTGEITAGFDLEPSLPQGHIPQRVVDELVNVRTIAKDYAQSYSDAVKQQAERFGIPVGALKRYVTAIADDKVQDARTEVDALERLLGVGG
jgi:hypothetical protein